MLEKPSGSSQAGKGGQSIASPEDAIRYSKASLSSQAAFAAEGFPNPPPGVAAMVADFVNQATRHIPFGSIANMSPGSGNLAAAAQAGVNIAIGSLSPEQRTIMRAGGNPYDAAALAELKAKLDLGRFALMTRSESGLSGNGGRFANIKDAGAGKEEGQYSTQHIAALSKMSGGDFASRLGFTGDQAKEVANLFKGTSGTFRAAAEDYNRVMNDPNSTPEQIEEAKKKLHGQAKGKEQKAKADKFIEIREKMRAEGVNLSSKEEVAEYKAQHGQAAVALDSFKSQTDLRAKGKSVGEADKIVDTKVAAAVDAAQKPNTGRKPKPATIQSTL